MPLVTQWTGREIRAFRTAIRMSVLEFAHKLGVSDRIVPTFAICGGADQESVSPMCPQALSARSVTAPVPAFALIRGGIPNGIRTRAAALKG